MINTLGHVALSVSDMERSLEFYRDFLGMDVFMDLNIQDNRIGRVIGQPDATCRIVHLKLGDGVLELFQYFTPPGENRAQQTRQFDQGLVHIGFEINEFQKHLQQLRDRNIQFLGEPVEFRPNVWVVYFRGPDGEICEFRQQPE